MSLAVLKLLDVILEKNIPEICNHLFMNSIEKYV